MGFNFIAMEQEIWKDIPWYEWLYKICNIWNKIISYSNVLKWGYMKMHKNRDWYFVVCLSNKCKKQHRINRLKAITFIPNPENKPFVNHLDWNKENNEIYNLEWCTAKENVIHAFKMWLSWKNNPFIINNPSKWKFWKNNHSSKKIIQIDLSWNIIKFWDSARDIYRLLWISYQSISNVCNKRSKTAGWYIWKFNK